MRHVTLDCHLIVFARPSSFFFFALWQEMVLVVAAPSISGLWLRLRKHCRSPVAEGGENYPMVFAVSFSNTASASPALLGVFSSRTMTGILQEALLGCPVSLHNGCPSTSQETQEEQVLQVPALLLCLCLHPHPWPSFCISHIVICGWSWSFLFSFTRLSWKVNTVSLILNFLWVVGTPSLSFFSISWTLVSSKFIFILICSLKLVP